MRFLECSFKSRQFTVHSEENFMVESAVREPCSGGYWNMKSRWQLHKSALLLKTSNVSNHALKNGIGS